MNFQSYLSRKKGTSETFLSLGLFISRSRPTASTSKIRPRLRKTFPQFPFFYFGNLGKTQITLGQIFPRTSKHNYWNKILLLDFSNYLVGKRQINYTSKHLFLDMIYLSKGVISQNMLEFKSLTIIIKYISLKESLDSKNLTQSNSFWRQQISQLFRWSWDRAGPRNNLGCQTESLHIEWVFYCPNELNWVRFFKF